MLSFENKLIVVLGEVRGWWEAFHTLYLKTNEAAIQRQKELTPLVHRPGSAEQRRQPIF